jgi:two-component system, NarL family, sensor kinase
MRRTFPNAAAADAAGADAARTNVSAAEATPAGAVAAVPGSAVPGSAAAAAAASGAMPRGWAWGVAWLAIVVAASAFALAAVHAVLGRDLRSLMSHQALTPFITVGFAVIGALVATRRPGNLIGALSLVTAVSYAVAALATAVLIGDFGGVALRDAANWFGLWVWVPGVFLPTMFVFLLFPEGRLPSPRWRPLAGMGALGVALICVGLALHPGPLATWGTSANPFGVARLTRALDVTLGAGGLFLAVGASSAIAALVARLRSARGVRRRQMQWLAYAAVLLVVGFAVSTAIWFLLPAGSSAALELSISISNLSVLGIAVAAGVAILQHRLYDIDLIINRTIVYAALTLAVAALYVAAVGALGSLFRSEENLLIGFFATGVVAILFQPLHGRLQRGVNRLLYGQRDDPGSVLGALGERLEGATELETVLPTLVETIARTLKLPYVALALMEPGGMRLASEYGRPTAATVDLPLDYQGERIGELRVAPRDLRSSLDAADLALLETIGKQAGVTLRSVQLTRDLRRSHQRLVASREEERRRLRRDLHDGLGPALASMTLQLDAAHNLLARDPSAAAPILVEVREQVQSVIEDLRRLVYDLRPPALDQLGLAAALEEQARRCEQDGMRIDLHVQERLPQLPAAVEVAAYRIVQEALTNVIRHAGASLCRVRVTLGDALRIVIEDDGAGLPTPVRPGVGLSSMRERASDLGGTFRIGACPTGGTRIDVALPVREAP